MPHVIPLWVVIVHGSTRRQIFVLFHTIKLKIRERKPRNLPKNREMKVKVNVKVKSKMKEKNSAIFMQHAILSLLILLLVPSSYARSTIDEPYDVRQHLSTVTRYGAVKDIVDNEFVPSNKTDDCTPVHINLVARHGTRAPTKKRMREMDRLATSLQALIANAKERKLSLDNVPAWLLEWTSPWKGKVKGGELIVKGEEELYDLGIRIRGKYPTLLNDDYHPDVYTIKATQVPRASASAVAFSMGLFSERGSLGPGKHRAFAVSTESRASDLLLRFFDTCQSYKNYRENEEPAVEKIKEPIFDEITHALIGRYGLNFTRQDISSLWFLCKQEASLLDITNQACDLFNPTELALLEWTDDLEAFVLKGYGKSVNYRMGLPLLKDVVESMELAIKANEEALPSGSYEKARLRFAHAETVVPFSCLLGLFLQGSEYNLVLKEKPLQLPPMPPKRRTWRGSVVAPFAGNNMLVLYSCPARKSKYFVHVLHNEHPVPLPGCDNSDFCPFEVFKERILEPHMKDDYQAICTVKDVVPEPAYSKFSSLFGWLFSWQAAGSI
ncbi:multiple inositol polyphosphate phosphatase 1-like isoform X2 [Chenopodium quinoa]|uniref:multiple inositol polyphosphate phosphatase 1-like isoform X2 n=1 Tax=Chenopodium quinoa TaxID=63459 RepID=UPI000B786611|nr:multiple inositol polyphosphate phosphatase 1-like isoform X2 [Chenopodium quinoa]